jgi:catechol 2,3-dioxygenase
MTYGVAPPGFRLPDATHVGAVRLQVSNLARSVDYYERVLGLRVVARTANTADLGPHGEDRVLVRLREKTGVSPVPPRGTFGLYHFAILLPDRGALGRFVAHLISINARVGAADHLVSEALYLNDPDGLGIEVYCDRPRDAWTHRGRELAMATDPLDFGSVMDAAKGEAWVGAPPGTRMGHIHLHVGNLGDAEAFYHAALGFDKTVWSYPGALFMSAGGYHHHLGTNTWSPGPAASDDQARLLEWDLVVPTASDAEAAATSVRLAGYVITREDGGWTTLDPWGTRVKITT